MVCPVIELRVRFDAIVVCVRDARSSAVRSIFRKEKRPTL
jgi:hypothetical protein